MRPTRDLRRPSQTTARQLCGHESFQPGQTADRVLIHVDTELGAKDLLSNRMAHLPSRAAHTTRKFSPTTARGWERRWGIMSRTAAPMRRR